MHPVVVAEREGLQLGVEIEAHPVGDELAERLPLIVLHHREESAEDRGGKDEGRGVEQRGAGRGVIAHPREQSLRMVDGLADELRDEELRDRREHGGARAERHPPRVSEGHARDAKQHPGIERDRGARCAHRVGDESERLVGGRGSGGYGHAGGQGDRPLWARAPRRARGRPDLRTKRGLREMGSGAHFEIEVLPLFRDRDQTPVSHFLRPPRRRESSPHFRGR